VVAISVRFELRDAMTCLERGFSRLYQRHLLNRLRASYRQKFGNLPSLLSVDVSRLRIFSRSTIRCTPPRLRRGQGLLQPLRF
jgi:hypothetical protein